MTIAATLEAYRDSNSVALIEDITGTRTSYRDLWGQIARAAGLFAELRLRKGDVVTISAENSVDYAINLLAAMSSGLIANPVDPTSTTYRLDAALQHARAKLLVRSERAPASKLRLPTIQCDAYRSAPVMPLRHTATSPTDTAVLLYTSGTTGQAKGICLSHENILANATTAFEHFGYPEGHRSLTLLPLTHIHGLITDLLGMLLHGRTCVIVPEFSFEHVNDIERVFGEHRIGSFACVPLILEFLEALEVHLRQPDLRFIISGAAPLEAELPIRWKERFGVDVVSAYGMTECSNFATITPLDGYRKGSVGKAAGCELRVVDENGQRVPPDVVGEVQLRGTSVMNSGYLRRPDVEAFDKDGWLWTGDLGSLDLDGYLYLKGRRKSLAIRGGVKIYLDELDGCLKSEPAVDDAASVKFGQRGEDQIVSFLVLHEGHVLTEQQAAALVDHTLGPAMRPDRVIFRSSIPRTRSQKVRIGELEKSLTGMSHDY